MIVTFLAVVMYQLVGAIVAALYEETDPELGHDRLMIHVIGTLWPLSLLSLVLAWFLVVVAGRRP